MKSIEEKKNFENEILFDSQIIQKGEEKKQHHLTNDHDYDYHCEIMSWKFFCS